ncbi:hypothetical protein BYT27DRAFT_7210739 [Phlegmacium glaucopus]|nr:hypothetical protein BYT27DRAFT_7210739 [Phlegmacium glaucopus]
MGAYQQGEQNRFHGPRHGLMWQPPPGEVSTASVMANSLSILQWHGEMFSRVMLQKSTEIGCMLISSLGLMVGGVIFGMTTTHMDNNVEQNDDEHRYYPLADKWNNNNGQMDNANDQGPLFRIRPDCPESWRNPGIPGKWEYSWWIPSKFLVDSQWIPGGFLVNSWWIPGGFQ